MNLLAAKLYDPAVAVNKVTTAALAMTALDTANLRLAITVPAHGMVRFRLAAVLHGAATFPSILLGVMNGATVLGRVAPVQSLGNTAVATALVNVEAEFTVTGLAPGAMNVDAAYGVETLVAATGLKYGGPNNATANDAFGAFVFEAWDPQPQQTTGQLAVDANGRVDVSKVLGTAQTARDLGAQLDAAVSTRASAAALATVQADTDDLQTRIPAALVGGRMDASVGAMAANVVTAAAINAAALNGKGDWNIGKTGYALAAAEYTALVNAIWDELTSEGRTAGSYGLLVQAIAGYLDTEIAAIKAKTDNLPAAPAAVGDAMTLTVAERASVADKLLGRTRAGGADGGRTVAECLALGRNRWAIVAGLLTVYRDDDLTPLYVQATLSAPGNPLVGVG